MTKIFPGSESDIIIIIYKVSLKLCDKTYMHCSQCQLDWQSETVTTLLLSGTPPEEQCDMQSSAPPLVVPEKLLSRHPHDEKHRGAEN